MIIRNSFTSDGTAKYIEIPFGVTWMKVINFTKWQAAGAGELVEAYWQKSDLNYGIGKTKTVNTNALVPATFAEGNGFLEYDMATDNPLGTALNFNDITGDDPPLVELGNTGTLKNGDIVRIKNVTGGSQLNTIDFTIGAVNANTSFTLANMSQIVVTAGGTLYPVKFQDIFYPRTRYISDITLGTSTVIKMTVNHDFNEGDLVRLLVPEQFGTNGLDDLAVKVTATTASTITVDYDSTGMTAFAWPLTGTSIPIHAQVVPMSPATDNSATRGMILYAGAANPAGENNDTIVWIAGNDDVEGLY